MKAILTLLLARLLTSDVVFLVVYLLAFVVDYNYK